MVDEGGKDDASGQQIHIVLDEAFDPVTAVVATVFTQNEFDAANGRLDDLRSQNLQRWYLKDLESFQKFEAEGLHASTNPFEVYFDVIDSLAEVLSGKTFIYYTDGTRRKDLGPKRTVLLLYVSLVQVLLRKYRHSHTIYFHFEDHKDYGKYFEPLVTAAKVASKVSAITKVVRCRKGDPSSLAVADYLLHVFGRARPYIESGNFPAGKAEVRNWWAVKSHYSLIYSMETHLVLNRHGLVVRSRACGGASSEC